MLEFNIPWWCWVGIIACILIIIYVIIMRLRASQRIKKLEGISEKEWQEERKKTRQALREAKKLRKDVDKLLKDIKKIDPKSITPETKKFLKGWLDDQKFIDRYLELEGKNERYEELWEEFSVDKKRGKKQEEAMQAFHAKLLQEAKEAFGEE